MEDECTAARAVCSELDVTWLLNRAAQRLSDAVQAEAAAHGIGMRAQLILTALINESGRTQLALGGYLAVDKTTLTTELDRMEGCGLIQRKPDPRDRRVRIPEITDSGRSVQAEVAQRIIAITDARLAMLADDERKVLQEALRRIVEAPDVPGSPGVSPV